MNAIEVRANGNLRYLKPAGLSENGCVMHSFALTRHPAGIFICMKLRKKREDLTGHVFGRLTVLAKKGSVLISGTYKVTWTCQCSCGTVKDIPGIYLRKGSTQSCGCFRADTTTVYNLTHGLTTGHNLSVEYSTWINIKQRCYNQNKPDYANYGARGITVCDRWLNSFVNFLADIGPKPSADHSIDRYPNNNGNYEPGNCRWATTQEQMNNTRSNVYLIYEGERKTISEWARYWGYKPDAFRYILIKNGIL